ncbi:MAG: coenzyme F390 synthetase [Methanomicrobiales archaeon]|nr:coenzyme F390 synthetase [Methanomicrobiales archaeon]
MDYPEFYHREIETMDRSALDALVEDRVHYTVSYAAKNSPFYRKWFERHNVDPAAIRTHEDLLHLPLITGADIRANQPPEQADFLFRSADWTEIFTIHETSGTSGNPKSFFFTWEDWERYAEKYARIFTSQGFSRGDRIIICASYGMNVGANTMTLAARDLGITIIPTGKCTFPVHMLQSYQPNAIVGSVFKLLHLARQMKAEGISPPDSHIERLIIGGESFADESREYLAELWGCEVFNTYGSTEGTMCGECAAKQGLHVPEDLVHLDIYDPYQKRFVRDGECGRIVLSTLLPEGGKCGTLLLNYDTEDTSVVISRDRCSCGRTHLRISNPQREAETVWMMGIPFNRVDVERGVFQRENMEYLSGEYEAFLYGNPENTVLQVNLECDNPHGCDRERVAELFRKGFFSMKPGLSDRYQEGIFQISFHFLSPGTLELYKVPGRPKRLVDRR